MVTIMKNVVELDLFAKCKHRSEKRLRSRLTAYLGEVYTTSASELLGQVLGSRLNLQAYSTYRIFAYLERSTSLISLMCARSELDPSYKREHLC